MIEAEATHGVSLSRVVSGSEAVLTWRDELADLSRRCGQEASMGWLEYYLARPHFEHKRPTLILSFRQRDYGEPDELFAAVLLYEYAFRGIGCRMFSGDFNRATSTTVAPPELRQRIAFEACAALLREGALLVQVTYACDVEPLEPAGVSPPFVSPRLKWAARRREISGYLPIEHTVDATLANLGKTTRRNLRYYRRRAEADLGATLINRPNLTPEQFIDFNHRCTHPPPDEQLFWRVKTTLQDVPENLFLGLQNAQGELLSLIGGITQDGVTHIEWQMNRADLPSYSLSTVMRSFLIEHEVARGTSKLHFIGGTQHSMGNSITPQTVVDLTAVRYRLPGWMVRLVTRAGAKPASYVVGPMLTDRELEWHPWK